MMTTYRLKLFQFNLAYLYKEYAFLFPQIEQVSYQRRIHIDDPHRAASGFRVYSQHVLLEHLSTLFYFQETLRKCVKHCRLCRSLAKSNAKDVLMVSLRTEDNRQGLN